MNTTLTATLKPVQNVESHFLSFAMIALIACLLALIVYYKDGRREARLSKFLVVDICVRIVGVIQRSCCHVLIAMAVPILKSADIV